MRAWIVAVSLLFVWGCDATSSKVPPPSDQSSVSNASPEVTPADKPSKPRTYPVRVLSKVAITLDGKIDEPSWQKASLLSDFCFPWREVAVPSTQFRAISDGKVLYFSFVVHDDDVVLVKDKYGEKDLIVEDRVEFYFAPDDMKSDYYCVEMDARSQTLDYKATFHRKFDFDWSFPDLKTAGKLTEKGYVVEGSVPLATLASLGLPSLESGDLRLGIFRAEFSHGEGADPVENWISWVHPHKTEVDFHVPATLGRLVVWQDK